MATSGKVKKNKGKTMTLDAFNASLGSVGPADGHVKKNISWADVMEDDTDYLSPKGPMSTTVVLPTIPRSARNPDGFDPAAVPNFPPFRAHVGNFPYECEESDLADFFRLLDVKLLELPRLDRKPGQSRGYGYIEFGTREALIQALKMNDTSFKGRPIRVSLPDEDRSYRNNRSDDRGGSDWRRNDDDRGGRGGDRSGGFRDGPSAADEDSAWRKPAASDSIRRFPAATDSSRDSSTGFSNFRSRGYEEGGRGGSSSGMDRGMDRDRDRERGGGIGGRGGVGGDRYGSRDNYSNGSRYEPQDRDRGGFSSRDRDGGFTSDSRRWNDSRASDSGSSVREFTRPGFGGSSSSSGGVGGLRDRDRDSYAPSSRSYDDGPSRRPIEAETAVPMERPRLILQKRTIPLDDPLLSGPAVSSSARNIFGEAKPVDTLKKELEVEQKLKQMSIRDPVITSVSDGLPDSEGRVNNNTSPITTGGRDRKISWGSNGSSGGGRSERRSDERPRAFGIRGAPDRDNRRGQDEYRSFNTGRRDHDQDRGRYIPPANGRASDRDRDRDYGPRGGSSGGRPGVVSDRYGSRDNYSNGSRYEPQDRERDGERFDKSVRKPETDTFTSQNRYGALDEAI